VQADIRSVTPEDVKIHRLGSVLNGGGAFPSDDKHATVADWLGLADRFMTRPWTPRAARLRYP